MGGGGHRPHSSDLHVPYDFFFCSAVLDFQVG